MKIRGVGEIASQFYALGSRDVPVFLLDGPHPALFDAGFTVFARLYEQGIRQILQPRAPEYLFLTHAHYDHIGASAHFKKIWPQLKIVASEKTQEILSHPRALQLIGDLNLDLEAAHLHRLYGVEPVHEAVFEPFDLHLAVVPGQTVPLGHSVSVNVIPTPGHTQDIVSYWVPEMGILIASDAVGNEDDEGYIYSEFLVSYDAYLDSLKILSRLNSEILCPGHRLVIKDRDVDIYFQRCFAYAAEHLALVEELLECEGGDIDRTVSRIKAYEWDLKAWPKQPEKAYLLSTRAKVMNVKRRAQMTEKAALNSA